VQEAIRRRLNQPAEAVGSEPASPVDDDQRDPIRRWLLGCPFSLHRVQAVLAEMLAAARPAPPAHDRNHPYDGVCIDGPWDGRSLSSRWPAYEVFAFQGGHLPPDDVAAAAPFPETAAYSVGEYRYHAHKLEHRDGWWEWVPTPPRPDKKPVDTSSAD